MPKPTRLQKVGGTYHARAKVPVDIRDTFGKSEVTRSLGTSSYHEAVRSLPAKSAEINQLFERHRQEIERAKVGAQEDVTPAQLEHIRDVYFHYLLEEDDETRETGFSDLSTETYNEGISFDDHVHDTTVDARNARYE